jgi:hypothetical protein
VTIRSPNADSAPSVVARISVAFPDTSTGDGGEHPARPSTTSLAAVFPDEAGAQATKAITSPSAAVRKHLKSCRCEGRELIIVGFGGVTCCVTAAHASKRTTDD